MALSSTFNALSTDCETKDIWGYRNYNIFYVVYKNYKRINAEGVNDIWSLYLETDREILQKNFQKLLNKNTAR